MCIKTFGKRPRGGGRVWSGAPGGVRREGGLGYKDSNSRKSHRAKKTGAGMEEG